MLSSTRLLTRLIGGYQCNLIGGASASHRTLSASTIAWSSGGPRPASLVPSQKAMTTQQRAMSTSGDHTTIWTAERVVSVVGIPALIVPFIYTTPLTDALFCIVFTLHSHWGIEALVVDYIRPSLFGGSTVIPTASVYAVWLLSVVTLGALFSFNYSDVGIVQAIKLLWSL